MQKTIGVPGLLLGLMAAVTLVMGGTAVGASHQGDAAQSDELRELRQRVAYLEQQLARLEELKPPFAAFMPEFSERFHVLHRAGEVGDWRVARHELMEMQRLVDVSESIDPQQGQMFKGFMNDPLSRLNAAIEHEDRERFMSALEGTVENCNACHRASDSGFVRVTLDVPTMLSMRHSHKLKESSLEGMEDTHEH